MQPRLSLVVAPEDINVHVHHDYARGWSVTLGCRRAGETWQEAQHEAGEYLTTDELEDWLAATLARALRPAMIRGSVGGDEAS
jgi:hypothetical protein